MHHILRIVTPYVNILSTLKSHTINMDRYLSTRSEVDLPFRRTRRVFNKLDNWCIAISAGTLLWFVGNFNKFIVKAADGVTEYIPHREFYVLFLILFFLSTVIFVFMRGFWYVLDFYDMRLRDLMDMNDRRVPQEPNYPHPLSPAEKKFMDTVSEKHRKDWSEGVRNEWFGNLRESNIERIITGFGGNSMYAGSTPAYLGLLFGTGFYLAGLVVSIIYVSWFLLNFYDP